MRRTDAKVLSYYHTKRFSNQRFRVWRDHFFSRAVMVENGLSQLLLGTQFFPVFESVSRWCQSADSKDDKDEMKRKELSYRVAKKLASSGHFFEKKRRKCSQLIFRPTITERAKNLKK
mmetsp:Transcript_29239/g.40394  ORF Transcript_29239/g.40394 Transcript_29239/m.40394 type:complete len:118 (-) Transcript_29239:25-378(-)